MASSKRLVLLPLLALAFAACAANPHRYDGRMVYLDAPGIRALEFPKAPPPGSLQDKTDFSELRAWQERRTKEQCDRAAAEGEAYFEQFFGGLTPFMAPLPKESRKFLLRVREDASAAVMVFKDRNNRPRPFHTDATLQPCLGRIGGQAYPSGHAALSRLYALMLSELAPLRRAEFMARADEAALLRVIGGVHHPTDIEAGKRLGDLLFVRFMQNPQFRAQLDKMRNFAAK